MMPLSFFSQGAARLGFDERFGVYMIPCMRRQPIRMWPFLLVRLPGVRAFRLRRILPNETN